MHAYRNRRHGDSLYKTYEPAPKPVQNPPAAGALLTEPEKYGL